MRRANWIPKWRVTECVVSSHPRAKERGRVDRIERIGNRDCRVSIGKHYFRVTTVHVDPGDGELLTIDRISAAARLAKTVGTTEKADADSLSDAPLRGARAGCFDTPYRLVAGHSGKTKAWKLALDRERVRMTDPAGFNPDQNLRVGGFGYWSFNNPKFPGGRDFNCLV